MGLFSVCAVVIMAADPSWKHRPIREWTREDALQVLTWSPWAKTTNAIISRLLTEDERRDGGKMGQDHGVGYDGVDGKLSRPSLPDTIRAGPAGADKRRSSHSAIVTIRWESALPIRIAESKAGEVEPPILPGDGYLIAVYGVPGGFLKNDPIKLGDPLKKEAALKREGKRDVKPSSVEVFQREDGLVVVYRFPLAAELTKNDGRVEFEAQIGRLAVVQFFDLAEMQFAGKLEL